ncbi:unnamed protein product [Protopolystoma xenopodis]|uniref:Uncharacterized protein n=1 Tax=Protopolystoma xenopodis TaxID=117903 RepID=A0A3S5CNH0_9PLAT|nr:unnamed protein product [Protopolystoma xenopodis]
MTRLTDDACKTSGKVPRPRSDFGNDRAYTGLRTRSVPLSLFTNVTKCSEPDDLHECRYLKQFLTHPSSSLDETAIANTFTCSQLDDTLAPIAAGGSARICPGSSFTGTGIALSSNEISSPTDPGVLRSGLSLIDLAVKAGRGDLVNIFITLGHASNASSDVGASGGSTGAAAVTFSDKSSSSSNCGGGGVEAPLARPDSRIEPPTPVGSGSLPLKQGLPQVSVRSDPGAALETRRGKRMPCQASPLVAGELRRRLLNEGISVENQRGPIGRAGFRCAHLAEWGTFALPEAVNQLAPPVKRLLLNELIDTQAQKGEYFDYCPSLY